MRLDPVGPAALRRLAGRAGPRKNFGGVLAAETPGPGAERAHPTEASVSGLAPVTLDDMRVETQDRDTHDRAARGHGAAILGALAEVQIGLLHGNAAEAKRSLAALAASLPDSGNPALGGVLRAIAQRAAIELARPG